MFRYAAGGRSGARVAALVDERKRLEKDLADARKALALGGGGSTATSAAPADEDIAGIKFSGQVIDGLDARELRPLLDQAKQRLALAVAVTDDLAGRFSAVELVRVGVEILGGKGGGGRADMAQGGGPDGAKATAAIAAVRDALARVPA